MVGLGWYNSNGCRRTLQILVKYKNNNKLKNIKMVNTKRNLSLSLLLIVVAL